MSKLMNLLAGAGFGAGLMYILDPDRGNRRRALVRDQAVHLFNNGEELLGKAGRDLQNRATGLVAETRAIITRESVGDEVLRQRVRSELGRVIAHPSAIKVSVTGGRVRLSGPILNQDVDRLLARVAAIRGVQGIENRLEVHDQPGDNPALQGDHGRVEPKFELMQENWTPGIRVLTALGGGLLALSSLRRGGILAPLGGLLGLGLAIRGLSNKPIKRIVGIDAGRRAVDLHKTINITAPVEQVFAFWENFENFPRFMSNVREIRDLGNGRSHWVVAGPAGTTVEWEATITKLVPNQVLAWKSLPGAAVQNAGIIRFEPNQMGGTQVNIKLSYNPPAGAIGHVVAGLFGSNPKQEMDEDLKRLKDLIEQGKTQTNGRHRVRVYPHPQAS